tara:strand:+ start:2281 stop:3117 length:837 start_codon:yes stop_codon:yes gene_type:complete
MRKPHKSKHNKKRNTAFLYEVLIQDITKSVVSGDQKRKETALKICKEFFQKGTVLYKERELYTTLLEAGEIDSALVEKLLTEAKRVYSALNTQEIFNAQTRMISKVNKKLSGSVFSNFVSNYKNLATIAQILNQELPVKKRIMLESQFLEQATTPTPSTTTPMEPTDNLVYKTFVRNYNEKYEGVLVEGQKEVITRYATAFSDKGLSLKIFLNEELGRLKDELRNSLNTSILSEDESMHSRTQDVIGILESYRETPEFAEHDIMQILEIQSLVEEMNS